MLPIDTTGDKDTNYDQQYDDIQSKLQLLKSDPRE